MIRLRHGEENAVAPLVEKVFKPMMQSFREAFTEGQSTGELIRVDDMQMIYAAFGANAFYYLSAPVMGLLMDFDPFEPGALEFRRRAAVEYLGQTIFVDREHGARVAARVLAAVPMPKPDKPYIAGIGNSPAPVVVNKTV